MMNLCLVWSFLIFSCGVGQSLQPEKPCGWMPTCICGEMEAEVPLAYTNCLNQTKFPKFPYNSEHGFLDLRIEGTFQSIATGAFSNFDFGGPMYSVGIIGSTQPNLVIESLAFNNSFRHLFIKHFETVTIKGEAFENSQITTLELTDIANLHFEPGAFKGLKSSQIDVKYCKFDNLNTQTFEGVELVPMWNDFGRFMTMTSCGLKSIPNFGSLGPNVHTVTLIDNKISQVDPVSSTKLTKLNELVLDGNPIDNKNLKGLVSYSGSLTKFSCINCRLTEIPEELGSLTHLEEIDLQSNRISQIPDHVFDKLVNLKSLILSNNPIGKIKNYQDFLKGIQNGNNLETFECNKCDLIEIPNVVSTSTKLLKLSLDSNKIKKIRLSDFNGTSINVKGANYGLDLSMANNMIEEIEKNSMCSLKWTHIDLSNNSFKEFDMSWIPNKRGNTNGLELNSNRQLSRVYLSDSSKFPKECVKIDLSDSSVEEVDKKVFNLTLESFNRLDLNNATNFDCSKDLRWMAECIFCDTQDAREACNYRYIDIQDAHCSGTEKQALDEYLRKKYLESFSNCPEYKQIRG